jgi:hypothetical protein
MSYYLPIKLEFTKEQLDYIQKIPGLLRYIGEHYIGLEEIAHLNNWINAKELYYSIEESDRDLLANMLTRNNIFKNKNDLLDYDFINPDDTNEFYALGIRNGKLFYIEQLDDDSDSK